MTAVRLDRLSVDFNGTTVLREVSIQLEEGRWLGLIGPNGAGKSTLFAAVMGLVRLTGDVELAGTDARTLDQRRRARRVAYVPQTPVTPPGMTVVEYALLGRLPHTGYFARLSREDHRIAGEALEQLALIPLAERELRTLSGGERQRVVMARALAQQVPLLLLDEPTSALDLGGQQQILELLDELRRSRNITVVTAMHDLTVAAQYADELALLSGGKLVTHGTASHVITSERIRDHYGAAADVTTDAVGRPVVRLLRAETPD